MIAFAEREFSASTIKHDGASERDHTESAARQFAALGMKPKRVIEDVAVPSAPPQGTEHIWRWFQEIILGLDSNGFGAPVVTWTALRNWSDLTKTVIDPWEARALVRLGIVRASILNKSKASG